MPKKFVVRLRKGGVAGNIVANSQVITINPLADGQIFPSNFQDGRLVGRIVTTGRAANFIKEIIPRPTTTTTTTTLAPNRTTTTTTLPPGTVITTRAPDTGATLCGAINFNIWEGINLTNTTSVASQIQGTSFLKEISLAAAKPLLVAFNFSNPILGNGEYEVDISAFRVSQNSNGQVEFWNSSTVTLNNRDTNYFGNGAWAGPTANPTRPGPFRYKLELYLKERYDRPRTKICELIKELTVVEKDSPPSFSITKINPQKVGPGGTMEVTIEWSGMPSSGRALTLGIIQGQGAGVTTDGKMRPDPISVDTPKFTQTQALNEMEMDPTPITGSSGSQVIKITFDKTLPWLTGDFQSWNYYLKNPYDSKPDETKFVWGNRDPLRLPILTKAATNLSLTVSTSEVYPGETVSIILSGLSTGVRYSVVLRHYYEFDDFFGGSPVDSTRTFSKSWFNTTYLTNTGSDGWVIGGTFAGDRYLPLTPSIITNPFSKNITAYYYPFTATGTSKTITLPVQSNLKVRYTNTPNTEAIRVGDERFRSAEKYKFEAMLMDGEGKTYLDANYVAKEFSIRDPRPIFQVNLEDPNNTTLSPTNKIRIIVRAGRNINPPDLGTGGIRVLFSCFGDSITSNSFKFSQGAQFASSPGNPHNSSYPGNQNFYYDIGTFMPKGFEIYITIELNTAGVYKSGKFGFVMYSYLAQDQSSISFTDYVKIAEYQNIFSIEGSSGVAAEAVSISNPQWTPTNGIVNETPENNLIRFTFDCTATSVKTVYIRAEGPGITADDFDIGNSGNFDTINGTIPVIVPLRVLPDAASEGDEVFSIKFFMSNSLTAQPFYIWPQEFTIRDTSTTLNEQVKLGEASLPPFYNNVPIAFVVTGGKRNTDFDIIANGNILMTPKLGDDGSWSGFCDFTGTPAGDLVVSFKFKFSNNTRDITINFVGPKGGTGSGGGCPDPDMLINISPDSYVRAGSLQVGDIIWTMHEQTLEYGYFSVTSKEEIKQPKIKITFDNDRDVTVSLSHRFLTDDNQYVWARDLREGSWVQARDGRFRVVKLAKANVGPVIKLEIERAHTYIVNGFISHNVKGDDRKNNELR